MHKKNRVKLLGGVFVLVALNIPLARAALPEAAPSPLFEALRSGDAAAVRRLEDNLSAGPTTRKLDALQLRYDVLGLLDAAKQCERDYFVLGTQGDLLGALRCNELARSSALSAGDTRAYLREALWAKTTLLPALTKAFGYAATFANGLDDADLTQLSHDAPAVVKDWVEDSGALDVATAAPPFVKNNSPVAIKINGLTVPMSVATSRSTRAPLWISVSPEDADNVEKKLGLKLLVRNIEPISVKYNDHPITGQVDLFVAPSIEVGPLVLKNSAVIVFKSDSIPAEVVGGLSLFRNFGTVTFARSTIALARRSLDHCPDTSPVWFASGPSLDGTQIFTALIDGKAMTFGLEFEANEPLALSPRAAPTIKEGPLAINAGGWQSLQPATYPDVWTRPYDVALGRSILQHVNIRMNMSPSPSICFSKT